MRQVTAADPMSWMLRFLREIPLAVTRIIEEVQCLAQCGESNFILLVEIEMLASCF